MLRTEVADALRREFGEDGYLFPDYEGYCFANVPHTVASVLGVDTGRAGTGRTLPEEVLADVDASEVENVLVVLVDGFGFEQWRRERDQHPFLDRLSTAARVTPLTSIYPSETAAAMTTFHTGSLPAEHGVVGWDVYEPTADVSFSALPFQTKEGEPPEGVTRSEVADAESLYPELAEAGVSSHHVVPFEETNEGATAHTYESLDEVPTRVREALRRGDAGGTGSEADGPRYCYVYFDHVDHESHRTGTTSEAYRETVGEVFGTVEDALSGLDSETAEETLLVVTADHGHVNTDPERNVNLDQWDWLVDALQRHGDGTPVRFAGSPRNVHLHLKEGRAPDVASALRDELDARVFSREEVLSRELFGDVTPSETFRRRLGDVVVSHRDLSLCWGGVAPDDLELVGMHGGLNPEEMLVPFAAVRLDELT